MIRTFSLALAGAALIASSLALADGHGKFTKAWEEADAARKAAAEVGHEWNETGKLLKQAKKAQKDGKSDKAMKLVAQALAQGNAAIAQHKREASAWLSRVPQ